MPNKVSRNPFRFTDISVSEVIYSQSGAVLRALIYRPKGETSLPALVCVHGGAWVSGDRHATAGFAEWLAATGMVVMAIDTRLAPQYPYPAAVADVNGAVRWLKYHAKEYGIDPERVGGLGVSSGGFLALLSAMYSGHPDYMTALPADVPVSAAVDAKMAFLITCSGVLDPLARYRMAEKAGYRDILMCHHAFFGDIDTMQRTSPVRLLSQAEKPDLPDALFFQGGKDPRLPPDTAENTAQAWRSAGGKAEAVIYPEAEHSVGTWRQDELLDMLFRIQTLVSAH